jgi:CRP/FNR family cyclic AMP-dependent transcriptional regulator
MDKSQKADALAGVSFFRQIARSDLERIANACTERSYSTGDTIVTEGDPGVAMFVIVSGTAEVTKGGEHVGDFKAGDFFGDMALFEGFPRSATVTATSDIEALAMTEWDFQAELRTTPELQNQVLKVLVRRLRDTTAELSELRGEAHV